MTRWLAGTGLCLLLTGCGAAINAPIYDGDLECKGKVALTLTGNLQVGAGYGGGGSNAASVVGDCGEGFSLRRSHRVGEPVK